MCDYKMNYPNEIAPGTGNTPKPPTVFIDNVTHFLATITSIRSMLKQKNTGAKHFLSIKSKWIY